MFTLSPVSPTEPLYRQLYRAIRQEILVGRLPQGFRLPASRVLAEQLHLSRNSVLEAFDLLQAEGFLTSRRGSGTFVAQGAQLPAGVAAPSQPPTLRTVSMGYECTGEVINFKPGTPDLRDFPAAKWLALSRQVLAGPLATALGYGSPEGSHELRQAICSYVVNRRGVQCHPEQIIITGGTTQAIGITAKLLLKKRKMVIVEDPLTRDIKDIFSSHGAELCPVEVDNDGIRTEKLPVGVSPACVYITPSHQFPLGATLPIQRRIDLISYAEDHDCYLVEDDYDSEFRYDGQPLSSLHGLSPSRVIYIGTFSKTLFPALRTGYLVLPPDFITDGRQCKWRNDLHNEGISQLVLARFIESGRYEQYLAKMCRRYRAKRALLEKLLTAVLPEKARMMGSRTGLHLVLQCAGATFTQEFFDSAEALGVRLYPVTPHALRPEDHLDKLLLGFGHLQEAEIEKGVVRLATVLDQWFKKPGVINDKKP